MKTFKNPLVVGYKGEIGSFILQGLLKVMPKALNIWCTDINENYREVAERLDKSDVVFLCVPMDKTIKWVQSFPELLNGKILIEQCSLKEDICGELEVWAKDFGFTLLSMHILFRPSVTPNKEDRGIAIVRNKLWLPYLNILKEMFNHRNLYDFSDYNAHDKAMAYHQALVHRTLLILNDMLAVTPGETFVSNKVRELARRIKKGDPKLYSLIQENKMLPQALTEFNGRLKRFDIKEEM
jgi:prephenate dehydrogenase